MDEGYLTYEQFISYSGNRPTYDNFILFFRTTGMSPYFRKQGFFQSFSQEHPDLEKRLTSGLSQISLTGIDQSALRQYEKDLYRAYTLMRRYGASDRELIGILGDGSGYGPG